MLWVGKRQSRRRRPGTVEKRASGKGDLTGPPLRNLRMERGSSGGDLVVLTTSLSNSFFFTTSSEVDPPFALSERKKNPLPLCRFSKENLAHLFFFGKCNS